MSEAPIEPPPEAGPTTLDDLTRAIQAWVSDHHEESVLVTQAILAYEVAGIDADGDHWRRINYCCPTDNWSLSGALGLIEAARFYLRRDSLEEFDLDEDDGE